MGFLAKKWAAPETEAWVAKRCPAPYLHSMSNRESYADDLRAQDIDPGPFLEVTAEAAALVDAQRQDEILARLSVLAHEVHAAGFGLHFPFKSDVKPLSEVFAGQPDAFLKALDDLAAITTDLGDGATTAIQRGIPAVCYAGMERPWMVEASMALARALGAAGVDPGVTLTDSVATLAEAVGDDRGLFEELMGALERFVLALDERGVHATYPIQQGICGTIQAWAADLDGLPDALEDLRDLVGVLQDSGLSPYPVLEYGVAMALPCTQNYHWLRAEVFPLAATLAAQGIDPILTLQTGIGHLTYVAPECGQAALRWAQAAAADGIDPGWFMGHTMSPLASACAGLEAFERSLVGIDALARAIVAHGHQPMLTFEYGLPGLIGSVDLDRVLAVSTALAIQGVDPGPPLKNGFGTLAYSCNERPEVAEASLALAEALVEGGYSPWRMLEFGLPAALVVAGTDDSAAVSLVKTIGDLIVSLHGEGIETDDLLLYGISPLATSCRDDRPLFETLLGLLQELVADLAAAGLSPIRTVGSGLPAATKASQGNPERLQQATAFARELAKGGIDPAPFLIHTLPALGYDDLGGLSALAHAVHRAGLATEPFGEALAALSKADLASRTTVLAVAGELAAEGVNPAVALGASFPALIETCEPERLAHAAGVLADALRKVHGRDLLGRGIEEWAFRSAIHVAGGDPDALVKTLNGTVESSARVAAGAQDALRAFLFEAPDTAKAVAHDRVDVFVSMLAHLAQWTVEQSGAPGIDSVLRQGLSAATTVAEHRPEAIEKLLPQLAALASLEDAEVLCKVGLPLARLSAAGDAAALATALKDLYRIGATEARDGLVYRIERLTPLVRKLPEAWGALIVPVCLGVGAGAPLVLDCIVQLEPHLSERGDLALIKEIVTQQGLRAPDVLMGLLLAGLRGRQIMSLTEDAEFLRGFISDVPFADPDYYAAYRRIMTDPELTPQERRSAVQALEDQLGTITEAVVGGDVTDEQKAHPLFAQALAYIFPTSRSAGRHEYQRLFDSFADRPEDLERLLERGPLPPSELRLATGGYQIRDGHAIDRAPWDPLAQAVGNVTHSQAPDAPEKLGEALFAAWIAGDLGKPRTRDGLILRIYQVHCAAAPGLPDALDDAGAFLKYREFLSDTAREIIQDALAAFRGTDKERYERLAKAKLAPRRHLGKGLLRGVARTCAAFQQNEIDRDTLEGRLERQLRGFDLTAPGALDALLSADAASLADVLLTLPLLEEEVPLGEEHHRVLADLAGSEIAAMGRELFGDGTEAGKVQYSAVSGGPELVVRVEPTKRRAHAAVGLCEGVCTAVDVQLWQTPEFLQCVFWGPDQRARGGMHLLLVERTVDGRSERALALPGINPTLELLREVGPDAILDAALEYAKALALAWQLDEVWIPIHRGIATNRGPIRQVLEERAFASRAVRSVPFSFSPYRYTFEEVWVL